MHLFSFPKRVYLHYYLKYQKRSPERYVAYLRKKGVQIGKDPWVTPHLDTVWIDLTRPSLITIGDNVQINMHLALLTHDFVTNIFKKKYNDFIPSSGAIHIGNNVYFGRRVTVLKGVTIGDNCVIGYGSLVTRSIPANSVAAGCPAKVICTLDEYYEKRKKASLTEAFLYAKSIKERFHRSPVPADFWEEFPFFVDKENISDFPEIPVQKQLGEAYSAWLENHHRNYASFEDFLNAADQYNSERSI